MEETDILMAVKGIPKQIVFITTGNPVTIGTQLNFIVDETLLPYINDRRYKTNVFFTWNNSDPEQLLTGQTIIKTPNKSGTDTFTLDILKCNSDSSVANPTDDELASDCYAYVGDISGKTGKIIVEV